MKRYFRISLFIFLLIALSLMNVKALEVDDSEIVNIKSLIPVEYDVDLKEEDAFILNEDGIDNVSLEITNQINNILDTNNIDLDSIGIRYEVSRIYYEEDTTINDYLITFYDNEDNYKDSIQVIVNYNNSEDYNEEDLEYVEEVVEDVEEITTDNYIDFYSDEVINETSIDDVTMELFEDYEIDYYNEDDNIDEYLISTEINGYTYIFKDGILYKVIPNTIRVIPVISVTEEVTNEEILRKVIEKYKDRFPDNITSNDLNIINNSVYLNDNYLGDIVVNRINNNDRIIYNYLNGSNTIINRGLGLTVRVAASYDKFLKVLIDNREVNRSLYNLSKGSTIVTLDNNFLNNLSEGYHTLIVRFIDGDAITSFTIINNSYIPNESRVEAINYVDNRVYYSYRYYEEDEYIDEVIEDTNKEEVASNNLLVAEKENNLKEIKNIIKKDVVVKKKLSDKDAIKIGKKPVNNIIPIVIIIFACMFGIFGYFLYRKSLD